MSKEIEYLDVVDESDKVVSKAPKHEIYQKYLPHRIVHVLIFDYDGNMLLQRRSNNCSFCPGHWSTSVGGHVQSYETYQQAAEREMLEEVGIAAPLEFFSKDFWTDTTHTKGLKKFLGVYKTISAGPFTLEERAVDHVEFFSVTQIQEMINAGEPFHPELLFLLNKYFNLTAS